MSTLPTDPAGRNAHMKRRVTLSLRLSAAVAGRAAVNIDMLELFGDLSDAELAPLETFAAALLRRRCDFLPVSYVAELLRFKKSEIKEMCASGGLPARRYKGKWQIRSSDLDRFMTGFTVCATAAPADE